MTGAKFIPDYIERRQCSFFIVQKKGDPHQGRGIAELSFRRPAVTVSYAQSLDGCIAASDGKKLALSSDESLEFVHRLRAASDAILVGIGTVLADNPRLTVRRAPGKHPQPIVLDTHLRFPPDAYLLRRHPLNVWIAAGESAEKERQELLERSGARVFRLPVISRGYPDIGTLLEKLFLLGIRTVMVEGGARVITSFLSEKFVDRVVITIAPVLVGGMPVIAGRNGASGGVLPRLKNIRQQWRGRDLIIEGEPLWER